MPDQTTRVDNAISREGNRSLLSPQVRRLREARHRSGITLRQLAAMSGVFWTVIWRIESGRHAHPQASTLRKIASALGVSLDPTAIPSKSGFTETAMGSSGTVGQERED